MFRLQNLVGDRPLVLGELGLDTLRHGEAEQARLLAGHLRETELMGLAGAYVFSWTDDWHTGGYPIEDWAFGITDADRAPKVSYHAVQQVFKAPLPRSWRRRRGSRWSCARTTEERRSTSAFDRCVPSIIRTTRSSSSMMARPTIPARSSRDSRGCGPSTKLITA